MYPVKVMAMIEQKKITANEAIVHMLQAMNENRADLLYKWAESYMSTLSRNGDIYHQIGGLLRKRPLRMVSLDNLSSDLKKLIIPSVGDTQNMYLPPHLSALIEDLLLEWQYADEYRFHNLGVRCRLLLYGPTGNGKTTLARHIAHRADLPLVEVNSDIVIDSHLGSTGGNIHKIFSAIQQPCVLFWDEVDSIGRKRGTSDSAGAVENDRMVNSILVNLEKMHPGVVFIGATNRIEVMDPAFIRRFHERVEIKAPTAAEKADYICGLHRYYNVASGIMPIDELLTKESYSDIKLLFVAEARKHISGKVREAHDMKIRQQKEIEN